MVSVLSDFDFFAEKLNNKSFAIIFPAFISKDK